MRPGGLFLIQYIEQMNWTYGPQRNTMLAHREGCQKGAPMHHKYDLFEKFPDGSSLWRACVVGLEGTRLHMSDLAKRSANKFYAMHLVSGKIVSYYLRQGAFRDSSKMGRRSRSAVA